MVLNSKKNEFKRWYETNGMSFNDTSIVFKVSWDVMKKRTTSDSTKVKRGKFEKIHRDTIVNVPLSDITNISFYKTANKKSIKRRGNLGIGLGVAMFVLALFIPPSIGGIPIIFGVYTVALYFISPVRNINLRNKQLVLR